MADRIESLWQEVAAAAVLGTGRKTYQPPTAGGALGEMIDSLPPEQTGREPLLRTAAVTTLHRKAGRLPPVGTPAFPPACPPDSLPRCSIQAGSCLEQILTSGQRPLEQRPLLEEWLGLAAQTGVRVREEHLPSLLEQGRTSLNLRTSLLPALGERGRWLAAQNPDWAAFAPAADERAWREGQRKERLAYLTDLRQEDPASARELLASTWEKESPADRLAFLQAMAKGLSMQDEPFLESVLDDRRKDVRQVAASLLAKMGESRLVARMKDRARGLLNWRTGLLRSTLEVRLPERCDESMLRDGIEYRPPARSKLGEKAWWLVQVIGKIPPRTWLEAWNKRPGQILDAARKHEWEDALLEGWLEAASLSTDTEWLEGLLVHQSKRDESLCFEVFLHSPGELKEKVVIGMLREAPTLSYDSPASNYLSACRHAWSREMTQAVTDCITSNLYRNSLQPWRWEKLMREIPACFHPDLLEESIERINAGLRRKEGGDPHASGLLTALEFRLDLRRAFLEPKEPV